MPVATSSFDAIIVGGGVIGCAIAWRLAQAHQRVALIERNEPGREASWAAGGMLAAQAEANQADVFLELALTSRGLYSSFANELLAITGTNIEYRTEGTLYLALNDQDEAELEHRWQWQHAAGLNTKKLPLSVALELEPQLNNKLLWALKFPDDHQVNARQLVTATHQAARQAGVVFFEQTEAKELLQTGNHIVGVATSRGEIRATTTILTAGAWSSQVELRSPSGIQDINIEPVRGQMVGLEMPHPPLSHVIYSCRGYVIPRYEGIAIVGSTSERVGFDKSTTPEGIASIIQHASEIAPALANQPTREMWAGLRPRNTQGDWPVLGCDNRYEGLVYATGHYRNGILLTPVTAKLISELVLRGETSQNILPFGPQRITDLAQVTASA